MRKSRKQKLNSISQTLKTQNSSPDLGFRVFKLTRSNFKRWMAMTPSKSTPRKPSATPNQKFSSAQPNTMIIEAIHIRNFKALKDVHLTDLPPMAVFLGRNGTGKTTLFHVFSFLKTCLNHNVKIDLQREGGLRRFKEVITRGTPLTENISLELKFSMVIAGEKRIWKKTSSPKCALGITTIPTFHHPFQRLHHPKKRS